MPNFELSFQFVASMAALVKVGLALALVVALAAGEDKCRTGCHGVTPNVFKFAEGNTYKYDYEGKVDISLSSADGQHSTTKVKATVLLTQQGQCNQVLRVQNLLVISADNKKYSNIADIEKPIVLNFHDGHIEDLICTQPSDTQNSLNVKRAVASMFQAALKYHGTEIDVFGSCPTEFSQTKHAGLQIIKKTRNLNKCAHREALRQDFMTTAFDPHSEIKTSPFFQGKYEAELKLKGGIPQLITVDEDYLYVPFSNGDKGAKANVQSTLKFQGVSKDNPKVSCNVPRSIIFEDPHPITSDKNNVATILKAVKDTANEIDLNVKENSANKFASIIKLIRGAPKKDLSAIFSQVRAGTGFKDKETAKRVFLDALFRARTGDAIEVGFDIYKSGALSDIETKIFFASLHFVQHATEGSLSAAANLLQTPTLPREAYLGIGVLLNRYCRQHSCNNVKGVNAVLNALQSKLNSRPSNRAAENLVLFSLKAIRNANYVNNALTGKIIEIAQDKQAPARVRAAALETYAVNACNDRFRDSAIGILKDTQQDSEIRIKAYLSLVECPNGKVATAIKNVIDGEPSIQVGGFIVSHLATIRSSTNPDKALARSQLGELRTTKKFPLDFRQYSFNGEYSYDIDTLGVGESVEANVIYSQKSFLPRSLSLNMTVEFFGHRYNFLEFETRQENLDALIAKYFGPSGLFSKEDYVHIARDRTAKVAANINKVVDKVKSYKPKREISKNQIETFSKQLADKGSALNKDLDLDLSVKLFGSEVLFLSLNEDVKDYTVDAAADYIFEAFDETNEQLKSFDRTVNSNVMFIDAQVSYPTSLGFPLRLATEGVASVQLKTSGEFPETENFKFSFVPSISAELVSRLVIDAAVVESGLSIVGNLYSSVGGAVEATYTNNNIDYKFSLPLDKQEILTVTHDIVFETRELCGSETRLPLKFIQSKDFSVCLDQLSTFIGLTLCADVNQPNIGEASSNILPFPLNGNSKLALVIQKNDFGHIHWKHDFTPAGFKGFVELINTNQKPTSTLKYSLNAGPEFVIELASPNLSGKFETGLFLTDTALYGLVRLTTPQVEYYAKLGVTRSGSPSRWVYKPIMEYKDFQQKVQNFPYHVTGQLITETFGQEHVNFTFDNIKLVSPNYPPISVNGYASTHKNELVLDLTLSDGSHSGALNGIFHFDNTGFYVNAHVGNDINKNANLDLKYTFNIKDLLNIDSQLQLIHGPDLSDKNAVLKLHNSIAYSGQGDDLKFETEHELSYPGVGLDDKFKFKTKKNYVDLEVHFKYQQLRLGTELEVELDKKSGGDFDVEFELYGFDNKLEVELERVVVGHKSKIHHTLTLNGDSIEVKGEVTHLFEQHRVDFGQDLVIKITSKPDIKWKSVVRHTQNDLDSSLNINCGNDVIFDGFLKVDRTGDIHGNLKVNLPNHLSANGNIKATKGVGLGFVVVNLLDVQRKIKTQLEFTVKEPTYDFDLTLFTNFEKDNSKKYRLTTNNQIKPDNLVTSKNTLEVLGQKTVLNFKVSRKGDINDLEDGIECELILPTEQYFAGKLHRSAKVNNGIFNGQAFLSLEQRANKNAPGKTLTLKGVNKNTDVNLGVFDIAYSLGLDNGGGETLNGELNLKKSKANADNHIDYNGKVYGSVLPEVLQVSLVSNYKENGGDYKLAASYGKGATLDVKGKADIQPFEGGQPSSADIAIDILTPTSLIRVIKFTLQGTVKQVKKAEDLLYIKGSTSLLVDDDGKQEGTTINLKYDTDCEYGLKEGHSTDTVVFQNLDPIVLSAKYEFYPDKSLADVTLKYSKDKQIRAYYNVAKVNNQSLTYDIKLETPEEKAKNVRLQGKLVQDGQTYDGEATLSINELKYVGKATVGLDEAHPSYDFELTYPSGKVDKLYAKVFRIDESGFKSESKVILHFYDFTLDSKADIAVHGAEDFIVKLYVDSPRLKLEKVSFNANTKETRGSKQLVILAKQGDNTVVEGTTTYKVRKEDGKVIIDGSGSLSVNKQKKSGNFKILYRELNQQRDKETGIQLSISSTIGNKGFDIEYILTQEHFKYLTSYCVEKKECAHVEIDRKEQASLEVVQINIDLRPLGVSHEFGLKSETDLKKAKHLLDVHLESNKVKYQYNALVLPSESHFTLTTPKRIVSLETESKLLKDKGPIKGHVVLYLNKREKPQEKSLLEYEVYGDDKSAKFDVKFTAPPLKKPLSITYKQQSSKEKYLYELVVDVLPNSQKKIIVRSHAESTHKDNVVTVSAKSELDLQPLHYTLVEESNVVVNEKDFNFEVDYIVTSFYQNKPIKAGYAYKLNKDGGAAQLRVHNKVIYDINAKAKISKEYAVVDTDYKFIGYEPTSSHLEVKNGNTVKFLLYKTAKPSDKLQINSGLIPGSIADFRMDVHSNNRKVDLVHGSIKLDESDFGKSDYGIDSNNIQNYLIHPAQEISQNVVKATTDHVTDAFSEAKTSIKAAADIGQGNKPDFTPLLNYYTTEAKTLREELITDESLKQLSEALSDIITAIISVTLDVLRIVNDTIEKLIAAVHQQTLNLADMFEKDVLPKVTEFIKVIASKVASIFESFTDLCFGVLGQISSFFDAHQAELKQIATTVSQISKDVIAFLAKVNEDIVKLVKTEVGRIAHELKSLPVIDEVTNYIKNLLSNKAISEEKIAEFKAQVEELKFRVGKFKKVTHLIDVTAAYIEKKLRNTPSDDAKDISNIVVSSIDAFYELIDAFVIEFNAIKWDQLNVAVPSKLLNTLPDFAVSRFSFINRLLTADWLSYEQFYSFATFNPEQFFVPIRRYAIVTQGQHIFTFDGKHLTFPGKCSYLLAKDVVDNQFSIAGLYTNGLLTELTFVDDVDSITLKKSGAVTYNGAATEFPVRGKHTDAFRTYEQVHLKSQKGVNIYCLPDLSNCLFSVSGFYHGHLRGLLGNANAEPYDDYTIPRGTIVQSESDFGNSYKIQANCPAVETVDHHSHHHAEACTKLFAELSDFTLCYPFVNPNNFRQACDHGVAAGVANTEEAIARAYVAACHSKYVPVFLPSQYLKCENSDKTFDLFDVFSVKVPQKAADVVFAIDVNKENEEIYKDLVLGLGTALTKDLADRGIKDVQYHILTYGGNKPDWPSHVTTNGGKMTFKGKLPQLKFTEKPEDDDLDFLHDGLNFVISLVVNLVKELQVALGFEPQSLAYSEANSYPFRAHATKAVIAVSSAPCFKTSLQSIQKLRAILLRQSSINLNLITPLAQECDFKVRDDKTTKNVIGFSNRGVLTFNEVKKKPTGNPDLLKDLNYNDFCSEYTVKSGGNVFVLDNFSKNKKLFTSVTSFNIAESLVSTELGLDCICVPNNLFSAKNVCKVASSKDKPPTTRKLLKG